MITEKIKQFILMSIESKGQNLLTLANQYFTEEDRVDQKSVLIFPELAVLSSVKRGIVQEIVESSTGCKIAYDEISAGLSDVVTMGIGAPDNLQLKGADLIDN